MTKIPASPKKVGVAKGAKGATPATEAPVFSGPKKADLAIAMRTKLEESLLNDEELIQKHGWRPLTRDDTAALKVKPHAAGFILPYFDLFGSPTKFYRVRFLEDTRKGFAKQTDEKPRRYSQPGGSVNEIYLSPIMDWASIAADEDMEVWITEGELKAACACRHGFATLGLGGVWNFKATKECKALLDDFMKFRWAGRRVYVCYDSDAASNIMVMQAEAALCHELALQGAVPAVVRLPAHHDGSKNGLDDFIVRNGALTLHALKSEAIPFDEARELHNLNAEVMYVRDPGMVVRLSNMQKIPPQSFISHAYADRWMVRRSVDTNGAVKLIRQPAARCWIQWPARSLVERFTYAPGQEMIARNDKNEACLNTWSGWGVEAVQGDVTPWHELMDYIFYGLKAEREWFEKWLAYPIQNPGVKMFTAAVVWGRVHGTGKSLIGYTMLRIYGTNGTEIGNQDLSGSFNGWAENRQFVMGDEITGGDKRVAADKLKALITQKYLRVNVKYVPEYTVPDCVNYYFTSNHPDAFFLEDTDRRYFIHRAPNDPKPPEWYRAFVRWLDNGGASALRYYFEHLSTEGFSPSEPAILTAAKTEMLMDSQSELGLWVRGLRDSPDDLLAIGGVRPGWRVWTTSELLAIYDPEGRTKVTVNGLTRELKRAGLEYLGRIRTETGRDNGWLCSKPASSTELGRLRRDPGEYYKKERSIKGRGDAKGKF